MRSEGDDGGGAKFHSGILQNWHRVFVIPRYASVGVEEFLKA